MVLEEEIGGVIFMLLHEAQVTFAKMVPKLINEAFLLGYEVTMGESYRTPEQAAWDAAHGSGIKHSLHTLRLAQDLNLFRDGALLTSTPDYRPLGMWWESQTTDAYQCAWGGEWGDGDHFSIAWQGVR